ncbi:MAG: YifB family Mg chelatase-like AAA ATPase [Treponemataceae bacterium]
MKICSFSPFGYEGLLVTVEVDLRRGIPAIDMVGLADGTVRESRERMKAAIKNSDFDFPLERVLISLCPSDVKKEGAGFDLPIALSVLCAKKGMFHDSNQHGSEKKILVIGELELSGNVRGVRGIHAAVATALDNNISACIIPYENIKEVESLKNLKLYGVSNLKEAYQSIENFYHNSFSLSQDEEDESCLQIDFPPINDDNDLGVVRNQPILLRALQIAAAGCHNVIAYGPPGCGKTLSIQRFPSLLPYLQPDESRSVTRIYSLAGLIPNGEKAITEAPFRTPHQSSSLEGITGGGRQCLPGEISLAHNGVLFFDEASEFKPSVLQSLRIPLETGVMSLVRAGRSTTFPALFQLMIASNPCPCGNFGDDNKICICNPRSVELFWRKFSSPLLDRIDLRVPVYSQISVQGESFYEQNSFYQQKDFTSASLRPQIKFARLLQLERQKKLNAHLSPHEVTNFCSLKPKDKILFDQSILDLRLSKRAAQSILKVARTICDMDALDNITTNHLLEAIYFRRNNGPLG